MNTEIQSYWRKFLHEKKLPDNTSYFEAFYFGANEPSATHLLELVLEGTKIATSSAKEEYTLNGDPLPAIGDYSIVTDFEDNPRCIIQTTAVSILKFSDMTFEICKLEGEDETLSSWQENHIEFFSTMGDLGGYDFSWDMEIVFEQFKVIYS